MEPTFLPSNYGVRVLGIDHLKKNLSLHDEHTDEVFSKPVDQCVAFQGDYVEPPMPAEEIPRHVKRQRKRRFKPPNVQLAPVGKRVKS